MANKREILVPDRYYHIYNRAIAEDKLFTEAAEYQLFLKKYFSYSNIVVRTYCYCLLSNHFHFLVQVRSEVELNRHIGLFKDDKSRSNYLAQHLGNFFNWYATYFNKKHVRKGSLFIHSFQRKPINDETYLSTLVCYIHANPVKAGLCRQPEEWEFSSYKGFLNEPNFILASKREEILTWFDGFANFKESHIQFLKTD